MCFVAILVQNKITVADLFYGAYSAMAFTVEDVAFKLMHTVKVAGLKANGT